jgi:GT2 family glycosyltransferase
VAISILNWNGWQDTIKCLESVRGLRYANYLTVVLDNGSWDDSAGRIAAWARERLGPGHVLAEYSREAALQGGESSTGQALDEVPSPSRLVLIRNQENLGFTGGNNVAIHYALHRNAAADYVFLLNNDALVESDCLTRLLEAGGASGAGIVGASIIDANTGGMQFAGRGESLIRIRRLFAPVLRPRPVLPDPSKEFQAMSWVCGTAMLIGREVLQDVLKRRAGYLDEQLFLYSDDAEFCNLAREAGYRSVLASHAIIFHKSASSTGGLLSSISCYYTNRNRVLLASRRLRMPRLGLFYVLNGTVCVRRILGHLAGGRLRAALGVFLGTVDGYRGIGGKWRHHDKEVKLISRR